jgi:hypothetical protein
MFADEKRRVILIVGGFAVVSVLIIVGVIVFDVRSVVQNRLPVVQQAVDEAVQDVLPRQPQFDENGDVIGTEDEFRLPRDVNFMGQVKRGVEVGGVIGLHRIEGWTLTGRIGDSYLLDFDPLSSVYLWEMAVYGPDDMLLALTTDSDAGYADFTQLVVTLPVDGTYSIVLRAFGPDGKYALEIK